MGSQICKQVKINQSAIQKAECNKKSQHYKKQISDGHSINNNGNRSQKAASVNENIILTVSESDNHFHLNVADSQAFNKLFIKQRQQAIDNHSYRSVIESWQSESLQQLVDIIEEFLKDKCLIDSHWIIFYWIAINIEYDVESYFSKNYKDQSAEGVFRRRKGVCAGYANIYKYLCDQLKISCEKVSGYAKGYGFDEREGAPSETDHAWNAVQIDQHWYLLDSTWGAGHLNDKKEFQRELTTYYFLTHPDEMIYHHLPKEPEWQLLQTPITMTQYLQLPQVHPPYFKLNLEIVNPRNQPHVDLLPDKPYALVVMRAPSNVRLIANLKQNDQKIDGGHRIVFDNEQQLYHCYFAPPTTGKYKIIVYGRQGGTESDVHDSVVDFPFDVTRIPSKPISFPRTWRTYFDLGLEVISPENTHLLKLNDGSDHIEIKINAPPDISLVGRLDNAQGQEVIGGDCVYYDRQKDIWRCQFAPDRNGLFDACIMAKKKSDPGHYTSAVSFKIDAKKIPSPPLSFPETWQLFYDLAMNIEWPQGQGTIVLSKKRSEVEIQITTPENVDLLSRLSDDNDQEIRDGSQIFFDKHATLWRCKFAPHRAGSFKALIMAKRRSDPGRYTSAVSFNIIAKQSPPRPLSYPKTWQAFHDLGLQIVAPMNSGNAVWPDNASYAEVLIQAPDLIHLSCRIEYNGVKIENGSLAQYDHEKKHWQLLFAAQQTGLHQLVVYAKQINDSETPSKSVVKFNLNVTKIGRPMKFPVTYTSFQTKKCQIYSPFDGVLKKGSNVSINCMVPGAIDVTVVVDGKLLPGGGYSNSVFKRDVTVGSKDLLICAQYNQKTGSDGLIQYTVR